MTHCSYSKPFEPYVWIVTVKEGVFLHAFATEAAAKQYCYRKKLDKAVRLLVGGIPKFKIDKVEVKDGE